MKSILFQLLCLFGIYQMSLAQEIVQEPQRKWISAGLRNTISLFNHGSNVPGFGIGGHMRIQIHKRINTEWFADFLSSRDGDLVNRKDAHIGWSVMYYVINPRNFERKVLPFVSAGHCFDYTRARLNTDPSNGQSRGSAAVQAGVGAHFNLTTRFDCTLSALYMMHLGKGLHVHYEADGSPRIELESHAGPEGHLLIQLSANYKFISLKSCK